MAWIRIVGLAILAVGGCVLGGMTLWGVLAVYWISGVFGLHDLRYLDVSGAILVVAELCFMFTAAAFGVGGLWQTVVKWSRDRKAKT